MVKKDIHKNAIKQVSKNGWVNLTGAGLGDISEVVEKEALRKKKNKKNKHKKDCGCDK